MSLMLLIVIGVCVAGLLLLLKYKRNARILHVNENGDPASTMPTYLKRIDRKVMATYVYAAAWLIKKSPRASATKIQFVQRHFLQHFGGAHDVSEEMSNALKYPVNVRSVINWVNAKLKKPAERKQLIDFLVALAFEDGDMNQPEYVAITRFADLIGFPVQYIEQEVRRRREAMGRDWKDTTTELFNNRPARRKQALLLLGLDERASITDIKKAYRRLVKEFHPDTLRNVSETAQEEAAKRFRELQSAYEFLTEG